MCSNFKRCMRSNCPMDLELYDITMLGGTSLPTRCKSDSIPWCFLMKHSTGCVDSTRNLMSAFWAVGPKHYFVVGQARDAS